MTASLAAVLLLGRLLVGSEFNRQEPISLDLKDASLSEVITLLGALANLPVSIAPDVEGKTTVQVKDVPYERVLELIGNINRISLRIEGGKLVATRARASADAAGAPAPRVERDPNGRRIPVEEYAGSFAGARPLFVQIRTGGGQTCARVPFENSVIYEVPLPASGSVALVTQFGWDPASRTRFLALEAPGAPPLAAALGESGGVSTEVKRLDGSALSWSVSSSASDRERCAEPSTRVSSSGSVTLRMRIEEHAADGDHDVMSPQVITRPASVFSVRTGRRADLGQHDEIVVLGYLSADGKSLAAVLVATAIRTDSRDGREYVYVQTAPGDSVRFSQLARDEARVAVIPSGPATEHPLELSAWRPQEP